MMTRLLIRAVPWRRPFRPTFAAAAYPYHNGVTIRNASFARALPKLAFKFIRVPAMFGGLAVGGMAWMQYQAVQAGNYATSLFTTAKDKVTVATSSLFATATDVAQQTVVGFERTREEARATFSQWVEHFSKDGATGGGGNSSGSNGQGGQEPRKQSRATAGVAAATVAPAAVSETDTYDEINSSNPQMMALAKEMIEIRGILQKVNKTSAMTLPSIVVIGSQSSGKSSVLEAIVGHDFLPKGRNMVTRRPIELTLVHTPNSTVDYCVFPDVGPSKITDFSVVRNMLTDLNQVPESVCVLDEPVQLRIHSRNVPDLSLIDLPGYIQVEQVDQPRELRQQIAQLCEKYIEAPNIILAVSSADTDLANSTALQASRRVDPRGERTIGVLTKMDLVDPEAGASMLRDNKYPLRLGYVGVVTKIPAAAHSLFKKGPSDVFSAMAKSEAAYFSSYPEQFGPKAGLKTGTVTLRRDLTQVLEKSLSGSLYATKQAIERDLREASYKLKSQFGDRTISAASYLSACLDDYKHHLRIFRDTYGEQQLHDLVKAELDNQAVGVLAERFWNLPAVELSADGSCPMHVQLTKNSKDYPGEEYLDVALESAASALAGCGVGELSTKAVAAMISKTANALVDRSEFRNNELARQAILDETSAILVERHNAAADLVEHAIKPFKFSFGFRPDEWEAGRNHVASLLKRELDMVNSSRKTLEASVGDRRKVRDLMFFIDKVRKGAAEVDPRRASISGAGGFTPELLEIGLRLVFLRDRENIVRMRIKAVTSKQCADMKNKLHCPEVFLDAAATKLASVAILHLNVELLAELHNNLPRALEDKLGYNLSLEEKENLAKQDPKIGQHLEVVRRKELLQQALDKVHGCWTRSQGNAWLTAKTGRQ